MGLDSGRTLAYCAGYAGWCKNYTPDSELLEGCQAERSETIFVVVLMLLVYRGCWVLAPIPHLVCS